MFSPSHITVPAFPDSRRCCFRNNLTFLWKDIESSLVSTRLSDRFLRTNGIAGELFDQLVRKGRYLLMPRCGCFAKALPVHTVPKLLSASSLDTVPASMSSLQRARLDTGDIVSTSALSSKLIDVNPQPSIMPASKRG